MGARCTRKKHRKNTISALSMMQFLNSCIAMKHISDEQAKIILSVLSNTYAYDISKITAPLKEAFPDSEYSESYHNILFHMNLIISACIKELSDNHSGCIERAIRYMKGFHNLPRAFLSLTNTWKITAEEAWEYSKSYLKA